MPTSIPANPWLVDETEFPALGSPSAQLYFLLNYAVLAPSSHNTQPWQFHVGGDQVDLRVDTTRALPVVDPQCRELVISCGAALAQLVLALHHFRFAGEVTLLPDPQDPNLMARVRLGEPGITPTPQDDALFRMIQHRHTHRDPFRHGVILEATLEQLKAAAAHHGAWLKVITSADTRHALTTLVAEADEVQMSDPQFRRELADWLRANHSQTHDGIPGYAMGMSDLKSSWSALAVRLLDLGHATATRDRELVRQAPLLAVLGTPGDTPTEWLNAGQALARLLLAARMQNIHAAFMNQPIEVSGFRARLSDLIHHGGAPQLLLRMGYGDEARPTPRRPVSDVVI